MCPSILWIEGKRAVGPDFVPGLEDKGYDVEIVQTGNAALARLYEFDPDLVVLNAASMRTTGKRICRSIRESSNGIPILVISDPQYPSEADCANTVLTLPFTLRKLINRLKPLTQAESKKMLHKGPIRLDLEMRRVECQGRETRLTPRLVHLLRVLMENAGVLMERNKLFREVWETDYIGDTRTLDVHINWLRKAIEEDPRNPKYLKTLRRAGYRLDV